jgi:hypothetical protein
LTTRFGNEIELLGYDLDTEDVRPGGMVRVTLYWHALRPTDTSYSVFVHLLDMEDAICGQRDALPLDGAYPTNVWSLSVVVRDEYIVPMPGNASASRYQLAVGLYDLATIERLSAFDSQGQRLADDRLMLDIESTASPVKK